jgi:hypothetical protein
VMRSSASSVGIVGWISRGPLVVLLGSFLPSCSLIVDVGDLSRSDADVADGRDGDVAADGDVDGEAPEDVASDGDAAADANPDASDVDADGSGDGDVEADGTDADADDTADADTDADADDAEVEADAGPCPDGWLDPTTNLCWQIPAGGSRTLDEATAYCADRAAADVKPWRLPTISELRTLVRGCPPTATGGSCQVTDDCLSSSMSTCYTCDVYCTNMGGPSAGCYWPADLGAVSGSPCGWFWTNSVPTELATVRWGLGFNNAAIYPVSTDCDGGTGACNTMCVFRVL